jgi:hypothetical protein
MKLFIMMIALVGVLAFAGTATGSPSKTSSIDVTLAGTGCGTAGTDCGTGGGGSCLCFAAFWNFTGRVNLSPPLGSFMFAGLYEEGFFPAEPVVDFTTYTGPFTYYRTLELDLKAPNGDKLVLDGSSSSTTAPSSTLADGGSVGGTWSVDRSKSTGRYARFAGTGTYTLSGTIPGTYERFTLALHGSLTFS